MIDSIINVLKYYYYCENYILTIQILMILLEDYWMMTKMIIEWNDNSIVDSNISNEDEDD